MCFGDADSLQVGEQIYLREALERFPFYDLVLRNNEDRLTWAVLHPSMPSARTPKFTFCRIEPSVMVMVEDQTTRRFCSACTIEQAVNFALDTVERAERASDNVHDAPAKAQ